MPGSPSPIRHGAVNDLLDMQQQLAQINSWILTQQVTFVSALPESAVDGQEVVYQNATMAAAGVAWRLRYRAGSASAHKWEFVGGAPLTAIVEGQSETFVWNAGNIGTWRDVTPLGPSLVLPLAGDYDVQHNAAINSSAAQTGASWIGVTVVPSPTWAIVIHQIPTATVNLWQNLAASPATITVGTAGATIRQQYLMGAACNFSVARAFLSATPVRVG